jgi:nucleotide-binding universal stress UspA family protein
VLKTILVGLDGTPLGDAALALGIRWAGETGALLVGLGVIDEPSIRAPEPVPLGAAAYKQARDDRLAAVARARVDEFLGRFSRRCAEAGVAAKPLEDVGPPVERLALQAQRYDLIVVGKETRFHFQTQEGPDDAHRQLLELAPRPVVTVPDALPGPGPVLVGYDGSRQAARTLAALAATGLAARSEARVVSVHPEFTEAARRADRAVEYLRFHGVAAAARPVGSAADPAEVLLDEARGGRAGLLVAGAYGKSAFREFFLGSVTKTLLREAPVPLFLYH